MPIAHSADQKSARTGYLLVAGAAALAIILYVTTYRFTFGERDAYRVFTGVIDAFQTGKPLSSDLVYGYGISRGYFALVELLRPWGDQPGRVALALNLLTTLSVVGSIPALYAISSRLGGTWAGVFSVIALMSAPIWFHGAAYAHPMWPAICFFLMAMAVQMQAWEPDGRPWMTPLAILFLAIAFSFRLDVVLMAPMYLGLAVENGRLAPARMAKLLLFGAIGLGLALLLIVLGPSTSRPEGSPLDQLLSWHSPDRFARLFFFSQLRVGRGIGPALIGAYVISVAILLARRDYVTLLLTAPAVLLNYLFWIPNPQPERHFLYLVPPLAISVGVAARIALERWEGARRQRLATASAALSILLLLAYSIYPWPGFVFAAALPVFGLVVFTWLEKHLPKWAGIVTAAGCFLIALALVASPKQLLFKNYFSAEDPIHLSSLAGRLLGLPAQERRVLVIADSFPLLARMMEEKTGPMRYGFDGPWIKVEYNGRLLWLHPQGWIVNEAVAAVRDAAAQGPVTVFVDPVAAAETAALLSAITQAQVIVGP